METARFPPVAAFAGSFASVARQRVFACAVVEADVADPAAKSSRKTPANTPTAPRLIPVPATWPNLHPPGRGG